MRDAVIPPDMRHYRDYRFSPAVRGGEMLHLSGQLGLVSLQPPVLAEGAEAQIDAAFALLERVLREAGRDFAHVLDIGSFHVGDLPAQMPLFMAAIARRFDEPYPAWTAVQVAGLALPGALVEIRATALA